MNLRLLVEHPPGAMRRLGKIWFGLGLVGGFASSAFSLLLFCSDQYRHPGADHPHQLTIKGIVFFVNEVQAVAYYLALFLFFSVFALIVVTKLLVSVFGARNHRAG